MPGPAEPPAGGRPRRFGASALKLSKGLLPALGERVLVTPNGAMFLPAELRAGLLPRLLSEILDTRVMVKNALKKAKGRPDCRVLARCLNARQYGLKMIANVTYGYTAAGFSGRMPCAEIADAIVSSGRDTLERAIHLVQSHPEWRAHVRYGDTDSMFVELPGRSRAEAFRIGAEIAAAVTAANPRPVKLQFEKVYHPCFLVTKKRYVGMMYETPQQAVPTFDAKGIETVRRDSCPAVAKMLERSIRLVAATNDLSCVKARARGFSSAATAPRLRMCMLAYEALRFCPSSI